jgi:hypothetical protein
MLLTKRLLGHKKLVIIALCFVMFNTLGSMMTTTVTEQATASSQGLLGCKTAQRCSKRFGGPCCLHLQGGEGEVPVLNQVPRHEDIHCLIKIHAIEDVLGEWMYSSTHS